MILTDLHIHSTFSDGKLSIPELIDLYGSHGFGAIAITDHLCENQSVIGKAAAYLGRTLTLATIPLYREILKSEARRAWREYRMLVIPGMELTRNSISNHRSAHILALGIDEWMDASQPIEKSCEEIRARGGLAIAAHPVSTGKLEKQTLHLWDRKEELTPYFDAWEVASGKQFFPQVADSGLPVVASSDLHRREQFSSYKTLIAADPDFASIKDAIRKQNLRIHYFDEEKTEEKSRHGSHEGDLDFRRPVPDWKRRFIPVPA